MITIHATGYYDSDKNARTILYYYNDYVDTLAHIHISPYDRTCGNSTFVYEKCINKTSKTYINERFDYYLIEDYKLTDYPDFLQTCIDLHCCNSTCDSSCDSVTCTETPYETHFDVLTHYPKSNNIPNKITDITTINGDKESTVQWNYPLYFPSINVSWINLWDINLNKLEEGFIIGNQVKIVNLTNDEKYYLTIRACSYDFTLGLYDNYSATLEPKYIPTCDFTITNTIQQSTNNININELSSPLCTFTAE